MDMKALNELCCRVETELFPLLLLQSVEPSLIPDHACAAFCFYKKLELLSDSAERLVRVPPVTRV